MEPTEPLSQEQADWSDVDQKMDDGVVEGVDDESWGHDPASPKATETDDTNKSSHEGANIAQASARIGPCPEVHVGTEADDSGIQSVDVAQRSQAAVDSNAAQISAEKWNFGSTFTAFAGALQQDVKEISESMKNALQHVKEELQGSPESFSGLEPAVPSAEAPLALDRSPFDDAEFQQGLEAIDDQVDQIASAAGKALGTFWTGLGGALSSGMQAASNIAGQLETAAVQAASRVSESTKDNTPWGASRGNIFRGGGGGTLVMPRGGSAEDEWQVVDLLGSPSTSVAASFEQLFKLYRGPRFVDDLEAIGNEAARSCNRIRASLPDDKRDELDAIVARTSAFINLIATVPPSSDSHSAARALTENVPPASAPDSTVVAVAKGGPREGLASMCVASVDRAGKMGAAVNMETPEKAWEGLCRLRAEGLKLLAEFTALSLQHVAFLAMCLEGADAEAAKLEFSADGKNKGAVVRQVLLQLLSDTDAIYEAFHSALVMATESDEFAALLSVDTLSDPALTQESMESGAEAAGAEQVAEGDNAGEGATEIQPEAAPKPQRDLAAVAKELKRGLVVGVSAAMDRILTASKHLLYPICAPTAAQLHAQGRIFLDEQRQVPASTSEPQPKPLPEHEETVGSNGTAESIRQEPEAQAVTVSDVDVVCDSGTEGESECAAAGQTS